MKNQQYHQKYIMPRQQEIKYVQISDYLGDRKKINHNSMSNLALCQNKMHRQNNSQNYLKSRNISPNDQGSFNKTVKLNSHKSSKNKIKLIINSPHHNQNSKSQAQLSTSQQVSLLFEKIRDHRQQYVDQNQSHQTINQSYKLQKKKSSYAILSKYFILDNLPPKKSQPEIESTKNSKNKENIFSNNNLIKNNIKQVKLFNDDINQNLSLKQILTDNYQLQKQIESITEQKCDIPNFISLIESFQFSNTYSVQLNQSYVLYLKNIQNNHTKQLQLVQNQNFSLQEDYSNMQCQLENQMEENKKLKHKNDLLYHSSQHLQSQIKDLQRMKYSQSTQTEQQNDNMKYKNLLKQNEQLNEMLENTQKAINEFKEKEKQLIKLVLTLKQMGIDIDKVYQSLEQSFQENSIDELSSAQEKLRKNWISPCLKSTENQADQSCINDSEESSYGFFGKVSQESSIIKAGYANNHNRILGQNKINESMKSMLKINMDKVNFEESLESSINTEKQKEYLEIQQQQQHQANLLQQIHYQYKSLNPAEQNDDANKCKENYINQL